jgi:hypothetical protein
MVNPFVNVDYSNLARLGGAMKPGSRIRVIRVMMTDQAYACLSAAGNAAGWEEITENTQKARTDHDHRNRAD